MIHTLVARRQQPRDVLCVRVVPYAPIVRNLLACRMCDHLVPASARSSQYQWNANTRERAMQHAPSNVVPVWYDIMVIRRRLSTATQRQKRNEEVTQVASPLPWTPCQNVNPVAQQ